MELEEVARKFALKNAVEYDGKCNTSAVVGQVINETGADPAEAGRTAGKICAEINQMSLEEQEEELQNYEFEEEEHEHDPIPDLPNAEEGEVVVRFAPNPNSPPHLGHSRGMVINGELRDKYEGKLILRYDDTDPRKKRPLKEAYKMYEDDYTWLGYKPDEVRYSSKNFDTYIDYAEELIEMGKAYVCSCDMEKARELRSEGEACEHRSQDSEETMVLWNQMKNGEMEEGEVVLKIKTDINHKNPAVRDFVGFRIINNPDHPITGDEYSVWPLLDFQGAIEDHVMGTTHIVRGKDLRASTDRQKYIYDYLGWEYPDIRYWGRVNIGGLETTMSSSSLGEMVENGELDGWDDPRAPTLRAFKKRGFQPEAIQQFWIEMGVNEKDNSVSLETLEAHNRDIVDDEANRYFFVKNPVEVEISNVPEDVKAKMPLHPSHEERGYRTPELNLENETLSVYMEKDDLQDGFIRLKGLCNIEVSGQKAEYVEGDHTVAVEKNADIIHWAPSTGEETTVVMPDGEKYEGVLEPVSIEADEVVQFERFGFVRKDSDGRFYYAHT